MLGIQVYYHFSIHFLQLFYLFQGYICVIGEMALLLRMLIIDYDSQQRSFGFAGTKDKRAVTTQRVPFSFIMPPNFILSTFVLIPYDGWFLIG